MRMVWLGCLLAIAAWAAPATDGEALRQAVASLARPVRPDTPAMADLVAAVDRVAPDELRPLLADASLPEAGRASLLAAYARSAHPGRFATIAGLLSAEAAPAARQRLLFALYRAATAGDLPALIAMAGQVPDRPALERVIASFPGEAAFGCLADRLTAVPAEAGRLAPLLRQAFTPACKPRLEALLASPEPAVRAAAEALARLLVGLPPEATAARLTEALRDGDAPPVASVWSPDLLDRLAALYEELAAAGDDHQRDLAAGRILAGAGMSSELNQAVRHRIPLDHPRVRDVFQARSIDFPFNRLDRFAGSVPRLLAANAGTRARALLELKDTRDMAFLPVFAHFLDDADGQVRETAVDSIYLLCEDRQGLLQVVMSGGQPEAEPVVYGPTESLIYLADAPAPTGDNDEMDPEEKAELEEALRVLGSLDVPALVAAIRRRLDDTDADVRIAAIQTLTLLADERSWPRIADLALDRQPAVQLAALDAIAQRELRDAVPQLRQLLGDRDWRLRARVARVFFEMGIESEDERALLAARRQIETDPVVIAELDRALAKDQGGDDEKLSVRHLRRQLLAAPEAEQPALAMQLLYRLNYFQRSRADLVLLRRWFATHPDSDFRRRWLDTVDSHPAIEVDEEIHLVLRGQDRELWGAAISLAMERGVDIGEWAFARLGSATPEEGVAFLRPFLTTTAVTVEVRVPVLAGYLANYLASLPLAGALVLHRHLVAFAGRGESGDDDASAAGQVPPATQVLKGAFKRLIASPDLPRARLAADGFLAVGGKPADLPDGVLDRLLNVDDLQPLAELPAPSPSTSSLRSFGRDEDSSADRRPVEYHVFDSFLEQLAADLDTIGVERLKTICLRTGTPPPEPLRKPLEEAAPGWLPTWYRAMPEWYRPVVFQAVAGAFTATEYVAELQRLPADEEAGQSRLNWVLNRFLTLRDGKADLAGLHGTLAAIPSLRRENPRHCGWPYPFGEFLGDEAALASLAAALPGEPEAVQRWWAPLLMRQTGKLPAPLMIALLAQVRYAEYLDFDPQRIRYMRYDSRLDDKTVPALLPALRDRLARDEAAPLLAGIEYAFGPLPEPLAAAVLERLPRASPDAQLVYLQALVDRLPTNAACLRVYRQLLDDPRLAGKVLGIGGPPHDPYADESESRPDAAPAEDGEAAEEDTELAAARAAVKARLLLRFEAGEDRPQVFNALVFGVRVLGVREFLDLAARMPKSFWGWDADDHGQLVLAGLSGWEDLRAAIEAMEPAGEGHYQSTWFEEDHLRERIAALPEELQVRLIGELESFDEAPRLLILKLVPGRLTADHLPLLMRGHLPIPPHLRGEAAVIVPLLLAELRRQDDPRLLLRTLSAGDAAGFDGEDEYLGERDYAFELQVRAAGEGDQPPAAIPLEGELLAFVEERLAAALPETGFDYLRVMYRLGKVTVAAIRAHAAWLDDAALFGDALALEVPPLSAPEAAPAELREAYSALPARRLAAWRALDDPGLQACWFGQIVGGLSPAAIPAELARLDGARVGVLTAPLAEALGKQLNDAPPEEARELVRILPSIFPPPGEGRNAYKAAELLSRLIQQVKPESKPRLVPFVRELPARRGQFWPLVNDRLTEANVDLFLDAIREKAHYETVGVDAGEGLDPAVLNPALARHLAVHEDRPILLWIINNGWVLSPELAAVLDSRLPAASEADRELLARVALHGKRWPPHALAWAVGRLEAEAAEDEKWHTLLSLPIPRDTVTPADSELAALARRALDLKLKRYRRLDRPVRLHALRYLTDQPEEVRVQLLRELHAAGEYGEYQLGLVASLPREQGEPFLRALIAHDKNLLESIANWIDEYPRFDGLGNSGEHTGWLLELVKQLIEKERQESEAGEGQPAAPRRANPEAPPAYIPEPPP